MTKIIDLVSNGLSISGSFANKSKHKYGLSPKFSIAVFGSC